MTVLLRVKRSHGTGTRPRVRGNTQEARGYARHPGAAAATTAAVPAAETVIRVPPAPQDRALYSCGCGFVFSGDVSTSVACPHCGGTQAW